MIVFQRAPATDPDAEEIDRIRAEYRRRDREIPADFYDLSQPAPAFAHARLCAVAGEALRGMGKLPLAGRAVLDVGCGDGRWLRQFAQWGARPEGLYGIDLLEPRLAAARLRVPGAGLVCGDARSLPWPGESFDVALQFTVFSSMLRSSVRQRVAAEMLRVLKPEGAILWYDTRCANPRNPNTRGMRAGEVRELFPGCDVRLRSVTLAPPLARRVAPLSPKAARLLEAAPFLRTHYFGIIRKPAGRENA